MKIPELRDILKQYSQEELRYLVVELYRAMPKGLKEEKAIDELFQNPGEVKSKKVKAKISEEVRIQALKPEIETFLEDAYAQHYFAPNRFVPQKERPKWRFKVKGYIRKLQAVLADGPDGAEAAELLAKIYQMLCYSCCYYLFNSEDPFRSVGIAQTEIYDSAVKKLLGNSISRENLRKVIGLAVEDGLDRETLPWNIHSVLLSNLTIPDVRQAALEEAKKLRQVSEEKWEELNQSKKRYAYDHERYELEERNNRLTELIFRLYAELGEFEEGICDYRRHMRQRDAEVLLYCLLRLLFLYDQPKLWKEEYQRAVKKKVKPRESLQRVYEHIVEHGTLPDSFYR